MACMVHWDELTLHDLFSIFTEIRKDFVHSTIWCRISSVWSFHSLVFTLRSSPSEKNRQYKTRTTTKQTAFMKCECEDKQCRDAFHIRDYIDIFVILTVPFISSCSFLILVLTKSTTIKSWNSNKHAYIATIWAMYNTLIRWL